MLHVIYGPDSFTAREVLRQVLTSTTSDVIESGSVHRIDGRTATQDEILQACEQVSLFGDRRLVVVEGLLGRFGKTDSKERTARAKGRRKKASDIGEWEQFVSRVLALPEQNVLILLDGDLGKSNPLLAALMPGATVQRLAPPTGNELVRWVQQRVGAHNGRIERDAAQRLAAMVGTDLWQLNSEIEKLVAYSDGKPIRTHMVDRVIASGAAPNIFMLVDSIVERNQRLARHRIDDMYRKGLSAGYVFTMVARQLRLVALVRETKDHRGTPQQPPGELAGLQPFALERATQQAERYTEAQVRYAFNKVLEADRAIKTGLYTERIALDMLLTNLLRAPTA